MIVIEFYLKIWIVKFKLEYYLIVQIMVLYVLYEKNKLFDIFFLMFCKDFVYDF